MSPQEYIYINNQQDAAQEVPASHEDHTILPRDNDDFYDVAEDLNPQCTYVNEEGEPRLYRPNPREPNFWRNLVKERTELNVPIDPFNLFRLDTRAFSFGINANMYPVKTHDDGDSDTTDDGHDAADDDARPESDADDEDDEDNYNSGVGENDAEGSEDLAGSDDLSGFIEESICVDFDGDSEHLSDSFDDELYSDSPADLEDDDSTCSQPFEDADWIQLPNLGYEADDELDLSSDDDDHFLLDENLDTTGADATVSGIRSNDPDDDWSSVDANTSSDDHQSSQSCVMVGGEGSPLELLVTDDDSIERLGLGTPQEVLEVVVPFEPVTEQAVETRGVTA